MDDEVDYCEHEAPIAFLPFRELPLSTRASHSSWPSNCPPPWSKRERGMMEGHGWRIRDSRDVAGSPAALPLLHPGLARRDRLRQALVHAAPQNAWVSDRSLCYLASGKPVVVQDTGPSAYLPERGRHVPVLPSTVEGAAESLAAMNVPTTSATAAPRGRWPRPTSTPGASSVACWNAR